MPLPRPQHRTPAEHRQQELGATARDLRAVTTWDKAAYLGLNLEEKGPKSREQEGGDQPAGSATPCHTEVGTNVLNVRCLQALTSTMLSHSCCQASGIQREEEAK